MSYRKIGGGWLRAAPSRARPRPRTKIHSGVTADSASRFVGLAGIGQPLKVFDSVRRCNRVWCDFGLGAG